MSLQLQLAAVSGAPTSDDDTQRFQQLSALLFSTPGAQQFLLAEMRVQQLMADVYRMLNDASGLDMPGV